MSYEKRPYRVITNVEDISEMDRIKRALEVHKDWIWGDGIEIAKLRTRVKNLEKEMAELKETLNRVVTRGDN